MVFYDKIEKLATRSILHNEVELFWCFDDLVELNDVGVSYHLEDVDFTSYSLNIVDILNFVFF